jgi:hypothetical protein
MTRLDGSSKPIAFTADAARRIQRVVQAVEHGERAMNPTRLPRAPDDGGDVIRMARTIGVWFKGTTMNVSVYTGEPSFEVAASPPDLIEAHNNLCTVENDRVVFIGLVHGYWYLLNWECAGSSSGGG